MRRVLVLSVMLAFAAGGAMAEPATVINQGTASCGMPGADADGNIIFGGVGVATTVVENGNKVMVKCHGTDVTNLSGRAQSFAGLQCGIITPKGDFVLTTDSHATVSASGVGTMTCVYKK